MRRPLITTTAVLLLLALAYGAVLVFPGARAAHATTQTVLRDFEATVQRGPDHGLALRGVLRLSRDHAGRLTGTLTRMHAAPVPVAGQLTGLAINLVFSLGRGRHLFGVGTFGHDAGAGSWFVGGPLVGPAGGDAGDWLAAEITLAGDWGFPHPYDD